MGIIFPNIGGFEFFNPRYEEVIGDKTIHHSPLRYKIEDNVSGEILSSQIQEFFDIKKIQYKVMRIYENFLHASDSINYAFNIKSKDINESEEIMINMGAYCLSEDSQNRYFGIEIKIYNFNKPNKTARLNVKIKEYIDDGKIPIFIEYLPLR